MFEISVIEVDNGKENIVLKKSINLDKDLDCFIMISSSSSALAENLLNNTLENIIDKITIEWTYNDFWIALENINAFLKTWNEDLPEGETYELDMSIAILNENDLMFSNIWKATFFLVNRNSEVIELTERDESKNSFLFISNWSLANSEIIISSTLNILKYLSKSDIIDGMVLSNDIEIFNKNIKNILQSEIVDKNCIISSMKYKNEIVIDENPKISAVKEVAVKALETKYARSFIEKILVLKQKFEEQSKWVKNFIFLLAVFLLFSILVILLNLVVNTTTRTEQKENTKNQIEEIKWFITDASKNVANPWLFNRNIEKAENAIKNVEVKNLYLNDVARLKEEINVLKKQFNKIELFTSVKDNLVYENQNDTNVKIIKDDVKSYILMKKWIVWPIIWDSNTKIKPYIFNWLSEKEEFIWGWIIWQNVFLVTNTSKVVRFDRNWNFSFSNVSGQQTWENIKASDYYNSSIYTLSDDNQIRRHPAISSGFWKWNTLLKEEDLKNLWEIISFAIDWWFYLVKKDLSIAKFYSSPYRLESLSLNKLPKNYSLEEWKTFDIKAWLKLNYVYVLMNNKIFVFKPNTSDWKSTRNLTYIWQVEWTSEDIIDFNVLSDGEILVLNKKWLYKMKFEVSDDKLIVR